MKSFSELGLSEELLQAVTDLGFENPMPVQEEVIPFLLNGGGDLVALAQTGTEICSKQIFNLVDKLEKEEPDEDQLAKSRKPARGKKKRS